MVGAFEADGRVSDHRDGMCKRVGHCFCKTRALKFVSAVGDLLRGDVHGVAEIPGADIPGEGTRGFGVDDGVFALVGVGLVGGEHHIGRVEGQVVELTDWWLVLRYSIYRL